MVCDFGVFTLFEMASSPRTSSLFCVSPICMSRADSESSLITAVAAVASPGSNRSMRVSKTGVRHAPGGRGDCFRLRAIASSAGGSAYLGRFRMRRSSAIRFKSLACLPVPTLLLLLMPSSLASCMSAVYYVYSHILTRARAYEAQNSRPTPTAKQLGR